MDSFNPANSLRDKQNIAQAVTIDNRVVTVGKVQYALPINGFQDNTGYVVDVGANAEFGAFSRGFASEDDAFAFLTGFGDVEVTTFDGRGQERKETVQGLGIPEGMIARRQDKKQTLQADMPSAPSEPTVNDQTAAGQARDSARIRELEAELAKYRSENAPGRITTAVINGERVDVPAVRSSVSWNAEHPAALNQTDLDTRVPYSESVVHASSGDPRGTERAGERDALNDGSSR